jgi:hypothetical protein
MSPLYKELEMESPVEKKVAIDPTLLAPLVRQATGREDLRLEGWQVQSISGGTEQGSGLFCLCGDGFSAGENVPWSMVLKIIWPGPGNSTSPQASHYWQREPRFYQSGILADLPGGLRAPQCYAALERPDGFWLFLEDVHDLYNLPQPDHGWPFAYYHTAARCLGQFNGAYLTGKLIPEAEWIPRQWLRTYIEEAAPNAGLFFRSQDNPFFRRAYSAAPAGLIRKAWDGRYEILDALERLPQVFCHQDAFCRNLFAQHAPNGRDQLVGVDWSYAGRAPLGSELGVLVGASMFFGTIPFSEGDRLEQLAMEGYLAGLEDAGWRGNPDLVRFGYIASHFWRNHFGVGMGEAFPAVMDERYHPFVLQAFGCDSMDQFADFVGSQTAWNINMYEEAFRLKKSLNL